MAFGDKPFGLQEVKLVPTTGTAVSLAAAQTLKFNPRLKSGEMLGNNSLVATAAYIEAAEWDLEAGGIPLDAYAVLTGKQATPSGTTPNQTNTVVFEAGDFMPYIKIYGRTIGEGADDIHVKIFKAKMLKLEGEFKQGEFYVSKCSGLAVDDGVTGIFEFVQNETAAELPAS